MKPYLYSGIALITIVLCCSCSRNQPPVNRYRLVLQSWSDVDDSLVSQAEPIPATKRTGHDPLGETAWVVRYLTAQIDPLYTQDTLRNYLANVLHPGDEITRVVFINGIGPYSPLYGYHHSPQPPSFPIVYQNLWLVRNDNATRAIYFDVHSGKMVDSTVDVQIDSVPELFRNRKNNYSHFLAGINETTVISWWKSGHGNHLVVAGSDTIPCFSPLRPVTDPHRQPTPLLRDFVCLVRTIVGDASNAQRVPDSMFVYRDSIAHR